METPEPARSALRQQTAEAHAHVEALLRLGEPDITWPQYLRALEALACAYTTVAEFLRATRVPVLAPRPWARLGRHLTRLQGDVVHGQALLAADSGRGAPLLPPVPQRSDLPTAAAAWGDNHGFGMLYVVEGSSLGGQLVARNVARQLGLAPSRGMTFFHGDGEETKGFWRIFREDLAVHVAAPEAVAQAVVGACWTFDAVGRAFETGSAGVAAEVGDGAHGATT